MDVIFPQNLCRRFWSCKVTANKKNRFSSIIPVSPSPHPLTQEPEDCGYEIELTFDHSSVYSKLLLLVILSIMASRRRTFNLVWPFRLIKWNNWGGCQPHYNKDNNFHLSCNCRGSCKLRASNFNWSFFLCFHQPIKGSHILDQLDELRGYVGTLSRVVKVYHT